MSNRPKLSLHDPGIPLTYGPLMQFADDPIACMKRLNREHGDLAVLEENDQRLVFVFSPELNREVLSNTQVFESRFFAVRGEPERVCGKWRSPDAPCVAALRSRDRGTTASSWVGLKPGLLLNIRGLGCARDFPPNFCSSCVRRRLRPAAVNDQFQVTAPRR